MAKEANLYLPLWNKYRPVIIQMMQGKLFNYQLSSHEFNALGNRDKYQFLLRTKNGKADNNISGSAVARDLLLMLQSSETAKQLMGASTFEISLSKDFGLKVQKITG